MACMIAWRTRRSSSGFSARFIATYTYRSVSLSRTVTSSVPSTVATSAGSIGAMSISPVRTALIRVAVSGRILTSIRPTLTASGSQ